MKIMTLSIVIIAIVSGIVFSQDCYAGNRHHNRNTHMQQSCSCCSKQHNSHRQGRYRQQNRHRRQIAKKAALYDLILGSILHNRYHRSSSYRNPVRTRHDNYPRYYYPYNYQIGY